MPILISGRVRLTGTEQKDVEFDTTSREYRPPLSKAERKTLQILGTAEDKTVEELGAIQDGEICY